MWSHDVTQEAKRTGTIIVVTKNGKHSSKISYIVGTFTTLE